MIKEFQRLKEEENNLEKSEWNAKLFLTTNNYLIQTDAVKNYLIPQMIKEGKKKEERFKILQEIAEYQLNILNTAEQIKMTEEENQIDETVFS